LFPNGLGSFICCHLDDTAPGQTKLKPPNERVAAWNHERVAHPDGSLRPAPVRAGEYLLGRQVGHEVDSAAACLAAAQPSASAEQTNGEVGSGSAEADGIKAVPLQCARSRLQAGNMGTPGSNRIGLVEARRSRDRAPQRWKIRLAQNHACPARIGRRSDRPSHHVSGEQRKPDRCLVLGVQPCYPCRIKVGEQLRLGVPG